MTRKEAFELISKERERQSVDLGYDAGGRKPTFDDLNNVAEWAIYVKAYAERALSKFMGGIPHRLYHDTPICAHDRHRVRVMKDLVKVAALAVACLEYCGDKEKF
jgi:hypothetical protein